MQILNRVGLFITVLGRSAYFLIAAVLILAFTYLFGFHILVGALKGGDAGFASHNLYWFAKWFPKVPIWYPLQGGGFAFALSYPVVPSLLTILIERVSQLDLIQALRVLTFGSYLFGALGIYIFAAWRMRNQTVGLMAAIFFLALPGVWFWITKLGYYAFVIATSIIPWGIVFFDWHLETVVTKQKPLKIVLTLIVAAVILGLAFLLHTFVGASLALGYFIYGGVVGWLSYRQLVSLKGIGLGLEAALLVVLVSVALFAFWFFPVLHYSSIANRDGLQVEASEQLIRWSQVQHPYRLLFDYRMPEPTDVFPLPSFPRLIVYLVFLALPVAMVFNIKQSSFPGQGQIKTLGVIFLGFWYLFWMALPTHLSLEYVQKLRFILSLLQYRVVSVVYSIFPLAAAFAIYGVCWIISEVFLLPLRLFRIRNVQIIRMVQGIVVGGASWLVFFYLLISFEGGMNGSDFASWGPPPDPVLGEKEELGFHSFYFRSSEAAHPLTNPVFDPASFLSRVKNSFAYKGITLLLINPPAISSATYGLESTVKGLQSLMELDQFSRVGLTGNIGASLQEWSSYTPSSTLNQFMYRGSLFQSMRGFSETVFFGKDEQNHKPALLADLSRWIGYKYVVAVPDIENTKHYLATDWEVIGKDGAWTVFKFKDPQSLATLTTRPLVLVISRNPSAYENVFRAMAAGVLSYQNAWIVEGKTHLVDQYSLNELQKFDGVVLYGYGYKKRNKAFSLLDEYVKRGGKLFMDTGWQFVSRDWQLAETPAFLPVTGLKWNNELVQGEKILESEQARLLGISSLSLEWEGKPWGFSEAVSLKEGAQPLLTIAGKTIIVKGDYGKGKVVWSGLNLFGYLSYHKYADEMVALGANIFAQLYSPWKKELSQAFLSLARDYPDQLLITLNEPLTEGTKLLWREPYSPHWRITLEERAKRTKIRPYRAGPGFLLMVLPNTQGSAKIVLEYKLGWIGGVGRMVSVATLALFGLLIFDLSVRKGSFLRYIKGRFGYLQAKMHERLGSFKQSWREEEY